MVHALDTLEPRQQGPLELLPSCQRLAQHELLDVILDHLDHDDITACRVAPVIQAAHVKVFDEIEPAWS